ncbi:RNA-binding protein [subsurface metagenome]
MEKLDPGKRAYLRELAQHLKPVIQVGKNGITESLLQAVDEALDFHELIKVKFMAFKEERKQLSAEIAGTTKSEIAALIGNIVILYREQKDPEKRKIIF